MAEQDRMPRELQKRVVSEHATPWKPANTLPVPNEDDGYKYRWLRKSALGFEDPTNMSKKLREGWELVDAKAHPELQVYMDPRQRANASIVEVGGLLLARLPKERAEARRKYYEDLAAGQMRSIDQQLMNEQTDSRMPIFNERQTKVSKFGRGS